MMRRRKPKSEDRGQHVFSGDLAELLVDAARAAERQGVELLSVADVDGPFVALSVADLGVFFAQAARLGEGVAYLSPDELGVALEHNVDLVDEMIHALPEGGSKDDRASTAEMHASLLRLLDVQNRLGGPGYRLGYLRQGVFHQVVLEDQGAAAGAALVEEAMHEHPGFEDEEDEGYRPHR